LGETPSAITDACNVIALQNVVPFVIIKGRIDPPVQVELAIAPLSPSPTILRLIVGNGVGVIVGVAVGVTVGVGVGVGVAVRVGVGVGVGVGGTQFVASTCVISFV
jgi:hypothetical protein